MTTRSLALASLTHFRAINAIVVAGVAVAVATLAGALLVGASVRQSLRDLALARLGTTDVVVTTASTFRAALADDLRAPEIAATAPLLMVQGTVTHQQSRRAAAKVNVYGIDDRFLGFHERTERSPAGRGAWLSPALAVELGAADGDDVVLSVARITDIPLGHLQGRRDRASERIGLTVERVATAEQLGEFALAPTQGQVAAIFVSLSRLQQELDLDQQANVVLVRMTRPLRDTEADVRQALGRAVQLADLGLRLRSTPDQGTVILESRTGLLTDASWRPAAERAGDRGGTPQGVLTYLANAIRANGRETPYSLVAAIDHPMMRGATPPGDLPPIWLNAWAADDLGATIGAPVEIDYYLWSDEQGLQTRSARFTLAGIVPMDGIGVDSTLTPEYPGITDAADLGSWEPPFPVELSRVRKKDEEYWDRWRAAPKAFIPLAAGQALWSSRYGTLSSLRTSAISDWPPIVDTDALTVRDVRQSALSAANGTTDFGEYFVYFSFFLVVSALLLAGLFFALVVEQRSRELGLLRAIGFGPRDARRTLLMEAVVLVSLGSLLGVAGAVAYAAVILYGLRTWWIGAVNTTSLTLFVDPWSLALGVFGAALAALVALLVVLRRTSQVSVRQLLLGGASDALSGTSKRPVARIITITALAGALGLVTAGFTNTVPAIAAFFGAGGLLLVGGCAAFAQWLRRASRETGERPRPLTAFGVNYARWRPTRSVLSASFIAFACFVIVAVTAFRRDGAGSSLDRDGGTGGFALMAESAVPLMHNPNTPQGRTELGLSDDAELTSATIARFRLRPGDEASCLNLYAPTTPRIVAPEPRFISERRFTFSASLASTDEERANPWLLLERRFDDGAVPAVADQTSLTYVFHLKVGDDFEFTPEGQAPIRLRIVGTLADSVLQSELIIGESQFTRLFPTYEGYRVWLIETPAERAPALTAALEDRLSDYGVDVVDTRARLAAYHQVENTYLSTFQALGALGLLLGTLGLAAVLGRNVLERRRELGLLTAVGFTMGHLRTLVRAETLLLTGAGVLIGTVAALVAIAPALLARGAGMPAFWLAGLVAIVLAIALVASRLAIRLAMLARPVEALRSE